jgi:hypothetical protein
MPQRYMLDDMTSVSVLVAAGHVNPSRLFSYGLSLGGWQAMWLGATDERIKGSVIAGIFLANACLNDPGHHHYCQTVPALWSRLSQGVSLFDTPDLARLIGGPVFTTFGKSDDFYSQTGIDGRVCRQTARDEMAGVPGFSFADVDGMVHEIDNLTSLDHLIGRRTVAVRDRDHGTQCNGMHCCPAGYAMMGVHGNNNDLLCYPVGAAGDTCHVDNGTQRHGMHACPQGQYLRGVHEGQNKLTCCQHAGARFAREAVDTSTQLQAMHGCPSAGRVQSVMTGIHGSDNHFLCGMP